MSDRLREIEERVNAATPEPWVWQEVGDGPENRQRMFLGARGRHYGHVLKITWPELLEDANAEFIAHAREDVPWLLAELASVRAQLEQIRDGWRADLRARGYTEIEIEAAVPAARTPKDDDE